MTMSMIVQSTPFSNQPQSVALASAPPAPKQLADLPDELIQYILLLLNASDRLRLARTCQSYYRLLSTPGKGIALKLTQTNRLVERVLRVYCSVFLNASYFMNRELSDLGLVGAMWKDLEEPFSLNVMARALNDTLVDTEEEARIVDAGRFMNHFIQVVKRYFPKEESLGMPPMGPMGVYLNEAVSPDFLCIQGKELIMAFIQSFVRMQEASPRDLLDLFKELEYLLDEPAKAEIWKELVLAIGSLCENEDPLLIWKFVAADGDIIRSFLPSSERAFFTPLVAVCKTGQLVAHAHKIYELNFFPNNAFLYFLEAMVERGEVQAAFDFLMIIDIPPTRFYTYRKQALQVLAKEAVRHHQVEQVVKIVVQRTKTGLSEGLAIAMMQALIEVNQLEEACRFFELQDSITDRCNSFKKLSLAAQTQAIPYRLMFIFASMSCEYVSSVLRKNALDRNNCIAIEQALATNQFALVARRIEGLIQFVHRYAFYQQASKRAQEANSSYEFMLHQRFCLLALPLTYSEKVDDASISVLSNEEDLLKVLRAVEQKTSHRQRLNFLQKLASRASEIGRARLSDFINEKFQDLKAYLESVALDVSKKRIIELARETRDFSLAMQRISRLKAPFERRKMFTKLRDLALELGIPEWISNLDFRIHLLRDVSTVSAQPGRGKRVRMDSPSNMPEAGALAIRRKVISEDL